MTDQLPRTIPTDPDEQEAQMPEWALSEAWKRNSARSLVGASVRYTIEHHPSVFDHALTIWQYMPEPVDPDLQMAREVLALFPGAVLTQRQLEDVLVAMAKRVREAGK